MRCCELLELAAVVATQGAVLIRGESEIPNAALQQYWAASKCRQDRWGRTLKASAGLAQLDTRAIQWGVFRDVLVEILASEVLTRCWTAVVCAHGRQHKTDEAAPIVRTVYLGHLEVRLRVISLLAHIERLDPSEAASLDRLRSRAERWSDWLIGHLAARHEVCEFAADPLRAAEFANELRTTGTAGTDSTASRLVLASIRAGFRGVRTVSSPNYDLNLAIGTSILSCFAPELFEGAGTLRPVSLDRFVHAAHDAQGLVKQMFREARPEMAVRKPHKLAVRPPWRRYGPA